MIWLLSFMKKYKYIIFPVLMALGIVAMVYGVYSMGHANGYSKGIGECNSEKQETINENIDTRKRQDKVVPIDGKRSLISGLRDDTAL